MGHYWFGHASLFSQKHVAYRIHIFIVAASPRLHVWLSGNCHKWFLRLWHFVCADERAYLGIFNLMSLHTPKHLHGIAMAFIIVHIIFAPRQTVLPCISVVANTCCRFIIWVLTAPLPRGLQLWKVPAKCFLPTCPQSCLHTLVSKASDVLHSLYLSVTAMSPHEILVVCQEVIARVTAIDFSSADIFDVSQQHAKCALYLRWFDFTRPVSRDTIAYDQRCNISCGWPTLESNTIRFWSAGPIFGELQAKDPDFFKNWHEENQRAV